MAGAQLASVGECLQVLVPSSCSLFACSCCVRVTDAPVGSLRREREVDETQPLLALGTGCHRAEAGRKQGTSEPGEVRARVSCCTERAKTLALASAPFLGLDATEHTAPQNSRHGVSSSTYFLNLERFCGVLAEHCWCSSRKMC